LDDTWRDEKGKGEGSSGEGGGRGRRREGGGEGREEKGGGKEGGGKKWRWRRLATISPVWPWVASAVLTEGSWMIHGGMRREGGGKQSRGRREGAGEGRGGRREEVEMGKGGWSPFPPGRGGETVLTK
jgi:hypothetical protein